MSFAGHFPKLVEVWNPEQKSFYPAHLLDIDEGAPFSLALILQFDVLKPVYSHGYERRASR
jgi:hypothetical protein